MQWTGNCSWYLVAVNFSANSCACFQTSHLITPQSGCTKHQCLCARKAHGRFENICTPRPSGNIRMGHPAHTTFLWSLHEQKFTYYCPAMPWFWRQSAVLPIYLVVLGSLLAQNLTCSTESSFWSGHAHHELTHLICHK